ncbi:MAG: S-methyl-5-thioribose-1-phosphate isomerase [Fibrobacteres bacterium]|nr:S-methyl-5-thioribose-1-phosphate isomerase [Fibrobacterota bacterium]
MKVNGKNYTAVWMEKGVVCMIDQRVLPHSFKILRLPSSEDTAEAIRNMTTRGAGSIGAAAGFGAAQAAAEAAKGKSFRSIFSKKMAVLRKTRPTAQDLFHALDRIADVVTPLSDRPEIAVNMARAAAEALSNEYVENGRKISEYGEKLIPKNGVILTHCNAGWLGLQDWGSALAPIYAAHRAGKKIKVLVDETRPRLQGMKLTAWELKQEGVPFEIIPDNAAGHYLKAGDIDLVITGADRIAINGDAANKIGTYEKAACAKLAGVPFYIAAPVTTFDPACKSGKDIPIEERDHDEVLWISGRDRKGKITEITPAPLGVTAKNPAFDVTPASFITSFITNKGVIKPAKIAQFCKKLGN